METSNQFQLEIAVDNYLLQLQTNGSYTPDDILELKSHLLDNVDALKQKQLNDEESFIIACKRLGKEELLHTEYRKVNGDIFYNRDLFIIVLSISTYLMFAYLYSIVQSGLQYFVGHGEKNVYVFGVTNYFLQILIVGSFIFFVFNSKKYLIKVSKLFSRSPANFSAVLIVLIVVLYFTDLFFQRIGGRYLNMDSIKRYYQFTNNGGLYNFVRIFLGISVVIAMLAAFVTSYKKIKFLDNIVNNSGYVALFFLGIFWDAVAASARMMIPYIDNEKIAIAGFGMLWFIGMLGFNFNLKRNQLKRNLVFIAFGFIMEFAAGIWLNPHLRKGLPVSVYFIALVIGCGAGYLLNQLIKRRLKLKMAK